MRAMDDVQGVLTSLHFLAQNHELMKRSTEQMALYNWVRKKTKTAISTIKEKFSQQQLQRFEESCFGNLLLIEDLKWTSPIVHGLLLKKAYLKTVSQVNEIKFIIGNKVIQFTAQQFCVVTGLRFGNLPFILIATNENCSSKRKYFGNDKTVNLLELEKAFVDCADEDDLAEDLEEFVKYPWSVVSYAKKNA
ncbi:unnamed protein product [Prunus armeniaca]